MKSPWEMIAYKCEVCGHKVDKPGKCADCQDEKEVVLGDIQGCAPATTDCQCPIFGVAKMHLPGCKYY
jgi:hypothetical protein